MAPLASYLPSIVALGSLLIAAAAITMARSRLRTDVGGSPRFVWVTLLAIVAQAVHFLEELNTGFFIRFPEMFGLAPLLEAVFVAFNLAWLGIWVAALLGVRAGIRVAAWPLWLLGLAAVLNLFAHPILALRAGAYFPGLYTAVLVGAAGVFLLHELARLTSEKRVV